jgi:elongation factor 1 alpha-like protein
VMHKYEQESKKLGKQSFMYAWVLDETGEERTRGITMDCGFQRFETSTKQVSVTKIFRKLRHSVAPLIPGDPS